MKIIWVDTLSSENTALFKLLVGFRKCWTWSCEMVLFYGEGGNGETIAVSSFVLRNHVGV